MAPSLRPYYKHCLNFPSLKRRLVDDRPDEFDDHPSLMEEPTDDEAALAELISGGGDAAELGKADASHAGFRGPATRAFAYELRQELAGIWDFYKAEVTSCSDDLASLQDDIAGARHALRTKAHGAVRVSASPASASAIYDADGGAGGVARKRPLSAATAAAADGDGGGGSSSAGADDSFPLLASSPSAGRNASGIGSGAEPGGAADPYLQQQLKEAMVDLSERCQRLVIFRMVNHDAARRLVSLHCGARCGGDAAASISLEKDLMVFLLAQPLFADRSLAGVTEQLEMLYASVFSHGRVDVARAALTLKASTRLVGRSGGGGIAGAVGRLTFGRRLGAAAVLLAWVVWDCLGDDALGTNVWHDPAFRIYRGLGNLVLLVWTWGANLWVWRRFGIDYRRCLSMAPDNPGVDPVEEVWNAGCDLSIAWLVSFLFFYKALRGVLVNPAIMPSQFAHTFPMLLFLYVAHRFFTPWRDRKSLMGLLWSTVTSPFGRVRFVEGYVGDVLTSIVRVLIDVAFALLYFASGVKGWLKSELDLEQDYVTDSHFFQRILVPFLTAAPLWWRFQQNLRRAHDTGERWPHLGNAMKYATAMSVSLFGTYRPGLHNSPTWISAFVGATLYQFTWDIFMDWDLLRWDNGRLRLRSRLLYKSKAFYVGVACTNFVLRFLWTVSIIPENRQNLFTPDFQIYLSPIIAAAEILRRSMWGFLRVENEHLSIYSSSSPSPPTESAAGGGGVSSEQRGNGDAEAAGGSGVDGDPALLSKVPFARMEISQAMARTSAANSGKRRGLRAWLFARVAPEERQGLLLELCVFSASLIVVVMLAGWQSS